MGKPARILSAELDGIEATLVEVEADINVGLHAFSIVGLGDKAVSEAKERVNSALKNSGVKPPTKENRRIVINLAPADVKKTGSQFDLAIALAYLTASGQIGEFDASNKIFAGELSLEGKVKGGAGILAIARMAEKLDIEYFFLPAENALEASLLPKIKAVPVSSLTDLILILEGKKPLTIQPRAVFQPEHAFDSSHWNEIRGQGAAKRALTVAAAGAHNILFVGPPGAGKTLLAQSLNHLLPPPHLEEAIEATQIWSAAEMLPPGSGFLKERPFRAPHHSASLVAIIGGGTIPKPGEISLAHRGVLFLDELPEFHRDVLEACRQPLESKTINISRARNSLRLPANFILAGAMNPCPCGYFGDKEKECKCTANEVFRYKKRLSGPLLDRIDIQIDVPRVKTEELMTVPENQKNDLMETRSKVKQARERQEERFKTKGWKGVYANSDLSSRQIEQVVNLETDGEKFLKRMLEKSFVSARGYYRILKISRTIADLEDSETVGEAHLAEAFQYRVRLNE